MAAWRRILGVLRRSPDTGDPLPDGELLARFAASRDQAAFELLVWRHAAMVFGVCRRALRDEHLAEDAFQAVFLVLARKAGAVRGSNVAGWLFRVARRVSVRAAKRQILSQPIAVEPFAPPLPDRVEQDELRTLLDAEIARLPERFRLPVLLCYLGGQSTEDAARQLGVPRGTILSRLATARGRLAGRLTRRGVTIPAVVVATPNLVHSTVAAAAAFAARLPHLATRPALVAEGVLRTMTITKLVPVAVAFLVVTGLVCGFGTRSGVAPAVASAQPPAKASPVPPPPAAEDPRALQLTKLHKLANYLAAQIDVEEKALAQAKRASAVSNDRAAARIERNIALLDAELFAAERDLAEQRLRRDLLTRKVNGGPIHTPEPASHVIEREGRVKDLVAEVATIESRLAAEKARSADASPAVLKLEAQLADKKGGLKATRAAVADELTKQAIVDVRRALKSKLEEEEERLLVTEKLLDQRKRTRNELEHQLSEREGEAVDFSGRVEALKPKKELLYRLRQQIEKVEFPDVHSPIGAQHGVEAKLDTLIREVEALRKDVSELKKR